MALTTVRFGVVPLTSLEEGTLCDLLERRRLSGPRRKSDATLGDVQCEGRLHLPSGALMYCVFTVGHPGRHEDEDGRTWKPLIYNSDPGECPTKDGDL